MLRKPQPYPVAGIHNGAAGMPAQLAWLLRVTAWTWQSLERRRQRQALRELDDRLLRDVGLTRMDVAAECDKPGWRP